MEGRNKRNKTKRKQVKKKQGGKEAMSSAKPSYIIWFYILFYPLKKLALYCFKKNPVHLASLWRQHPDVDLMA